MTEFFKYISVSGTMGVGKTTFVKLLAKEFVFKPIFENFKANPFLAKFYKDMKRWAFHSQMYFLVQKIGQMGQIRLMGKEKIVQDTPIYQDVFSYAKAQYLLGNMHKAEWELYFRAYKSFEEYLIKPKLIIHLTAPVEIIYERIKKRDRAYETAKNKKIFLNYLRALDRLNFEWIERIKRKIRIVLINTDGRNYFNDREKKKELIRYI